MSQILSDDSRRLSHADAGRTLLAATESSVLATLDESGHPYGSAVEHVLEDDGRILLLLSDLAAHTKNLRGDPRASLVSMQDAGSPAVARSRISVQGPLSQVDKDPARVEAYTAVHNHSTTYVNFNDFHFFQMRVEKARYIEGFGRMDWIDAESWGQAEVDPIRLVADGIIEHMNVDHGHNLVDYAKAYTDQASPDHVTMTGLDRFGFDLKIESGSKTDEVRLTFARPHTTQDEIHEVMVRLAREARSMLA